MGKKDSILINKEIFIALPLTIYFVIGLFSFIWAGTECDWKGKCSLSSIVDYEPVHLLACELFKKRW